MIPGLGQCLFGVNCAEKFDEVMFPIGEALAARVVALARRAKALAKRLRGPRPTDHLWEARYWYRDPQMAHTWDAIVYVGAPLRDMRVNMLRAGVYFKTPEAQEE